MPPHQIFFMGSEIQMKKGNMGNHKVLNFHIGKWQLEIFSENSSQEFKSWLPISFIPDDTYLTM